MCVQDPNDAAVELVQRLMVRYPTVDAKLFYGTCLNHFLTVFSLSLSLVKSNRFDVFNKVAKTCVRIQK